MKKSILVLLISTVLFISLGGAGHDNSEYENFQAYNEDPTAENFQKAYDYYSTQEDDNSAILQAYLHWMELNKVIDKLDSNVDSLDTATGFQYANLLLEIGKNEQAIDIYDKLNAETPNWGCPWRHKGEAYWNMKNYTASETALLKSIEVRKNHYDAYVMLAEVYNEQGKHEDALKTLEEGLQYAPENPEYSEDEEFEDNVGKLHKELLEKCGKK